jgi:branched-chain amino acid transport system ATP-binding protein
VELCRFEDVRVTFGGVAVLNDLSFTIDSDSGMTGIIGPNGAGKSTTLNVLTGSVPLAGGSAFILGHGVTRRTTPAIVARYGVGRTFQTPRPFGRMTIRENLLAASEAQTVATGASRKRRRAEVEALLERLSLAGVADRLAGGASLAERKRIELGKTLALRPRLVLLDEMFEGLSESEVTSMVETLRQLNAEGIDFVFIEHVMRALRSLADHLLVLDKGELIAAGPTDSVLSDVNVRRAYLGMGQADGASGTAPRDEPAGERASPGATAGGRDAVRSRFRRHA